MRCAVALVLLLLAGCTSTSAPPQTTTTVAASPSAVKPSSAAGITGVRASDWPVPDNTLTPGNVNPACPPARIVSPDLKLLVSEGYHTGKPGEYDHRIPKFLCGSDETACPKGMIACPAAVANIWPEPADGWHAPFQLNRKDQLEDKISSLVRGGWLDRPHAIAVFARPADWRAGWCAFVHTTKAKDGVDCRPWNTR